MGGVSASDAPSWSVSSLLGTRIFHFAEPAIHRDVRSEPCQAWESVRDLLYIQLFSALRPAISQNIVYCVRSIHARLSEIRPIYGKVSEVLYLTEGDNDASAEPRRPTACLRSPRQRFSSRLRELGRPALTFNFLSKVRYRVLRGLTVGVVTLIISHVSQLNTLRDGSAYIWHLSHRSNPYS